MTITEALEAYLRRREQEGYSSHTLAAYRLQIGLLVRDVGDLDVREVTTDTLRGHLDKCIHRMKPTSVAHKVRAIRVFFKWLYEEELIAKNPGFKIKEPMLGKRIPKAMTMDEVELIRDACKDPFERALIELCFATGARVGEINRMNRDDINFDNRSIRVLGKGRGGGDEREVYFGAKAALRLRAYLADRKDLDPALLVTERNPHGRLSIHEIQYVMRRIVKRSGVTRHVTPHTWRHTLATFLLDQGAPIDVVQEILGHEKSESTRIYASRSGRKRAEEYRRYFVG